MTRYIDADALKEHIITPRSNGKALLEEWIDAQPTIDAKPVRHGTWIGKSTGGTPFYCCSECGRVEWDTPTNYCPNCGARMDKDE